MIAAGLVQAFMGTEAAQKKLEDVAKPVSAEEAEEPEPEPEPERRPRLRLGPSQGQLSYSPFSSISSRSEEDPDLRTEVDAIARAVSAEGELRRRELGELVECRYWGPGRFRRALRTAKSEGLIKSLGRDRFAPADS